MKQAQIVLDFINAMALPATKATRDMVSNLPVAHTSGGNTFVDTWRFADGSVLTFNHLANRGHEWSVE